MDPYFLIFFLLQFCLNMSNTLVATTSLFVRISFYWHFFERAPLAAFRRAYEECFPRTIRSATPSWSLVIEPVKINTLCCSECQATRAAERICLTLARVISENLFYIVF